jgi:hypothetical protein
VSSDPSSKEKRRRGYSSLDAIDPNDGGKWQVLLSDDKMDWVASQGRGAALELADTVRWSLIHPRAIFRGIRDLERDIVEDQWLCYIACPQHAYDHKTGQKRGAWTGEVFMVFVTDDRVLYGWYWAECDQHDAHLPNDFEDRFRERLL